MEPIAACSQMIERTCKAVALVLDEAERLAETTRSQAVLPA